MAFWQEFQWIPDRDVRLKCLSPIHTFIHSLLTELRYMLQNFHRQTCMQEMNCSLFNLASPSKFGITAPCIKGSHRSADVLEWFWAHHSLKCQLLNLKDFYSNLTTVSRYILGNLPHTTQEPK